MKLAVMNVLCEEVDMTVKRSWKVLMGGAAPVVVLVLATALFLRSTAAGPTVTVYKSPT